MLFLPLLLALPARAANPDKKELIRIAATQAAKMGVPPCLAKVIVTGESGGNPAIIGHDENYPGEKPVVARKRFLKSGRKYSGATFTPTTPGSSAAKGLRNDAGVSALGAKTGPGKYADLSDWPDYKLDWRFTKGLGLGQITFGGEDYCKVDGKVAGTTCTINGKAVQGTFCKVDGKLVRGTMIKKAGGCKTVPWLLTKEGGVTAMVARLAYWHDHAKKKVTADPDLVVKKCKDGSKVAGVRAEPLSDRILRATISAYGAGYNFGNTCRGAPTNRVPLVKKCIASGEKFDGGEVAKDDDDHGGGSLKGADDPIAKNDPDPDPDDDDDDPLLQRFTDWIKGKLAAAAKGFAGETGHITVSSAWVRSAGSSDASRVKVLARCTKLRIVSKKTSWVQVEAGKTKGWIFYKYVKPGTKSARCG